MIDRGREAGKRWSALPLKKRLYLLQKLQAIILARQHEIVDLICRETGKVPLEAYMGEILPTLEFIKYLVKKSEKILAPEKRSTPSGWGKYESWVEYRPYGVALIISPWNYPFQLSLTPLLSALVTGNAVILKISEIVPNMVSLLESLFKEALFPEGLVQVCTGDGVFSQSLISEKPDFIFFTGSVATGKKVAKAAGEYLIPTVLELGGKDPFIVCDDAPFQRSVHAAVYGAFANSGQICVSAERAYIDKKIFEPWCKALVKETEKVKVGAGENADIGRLTTSQQLKIIQDQVEDALSKGAKLLTSPKKYGPYLFPIILKDVNPSMKITQEETFGPVLTVAPFETDQEAIELANASPFGLNASVWTKNLKRGRKIASQLEVGNCAINDVIRNIGNPDLPFGGVKQSGYGYSRGPEGVKMFCRVKSVMQSKGTLTHELNWFPYSKELYLHLTNFFQWIYGPKNKLVWIFKNLETLKYLRKLLR